MEKQTADYWIKKLGLSPHPEGGYYRRIYCSTRTFGGAPAPGFSGDRPFYSGIYYLLPNEEFSALHRIPNDEIWNYCIGDPLRIFTLSGECELNNYYLGPCPENTQSFTIRIPGQTWFAACPAAENEGYSLVTCFVSPGFDYSDFELGSRKDLSQKFPEHRRLIRNYCIRP